MRSSKTWLLLLAVAAAALLAACGGGDGAGRAYTGGGDGGGAPTELTVEMTEFGFAPAAVSVPTGGEVTVTAENQGSIEHDWVVLEQGREITAETDLPDDADEIRSEWAVAGLHAMPGEAETTTFTAPAEGTYQIICIVPGHFSAGMAGELTVTTG